MASLTISSAGVVKTSDSVLVDNAGTAGEAVAKAGEAAYKGSDGKYYLALNDTAPHAAAVGVFMNPAAAGQPVVIMKGKITYTGTTTIAVGATYSVGSVAGDISDDADVTTGKFKTVFAVGLTSSSLLISPVASGVAVA